MPQCIGVRKHKWAGHCYPLGPGSKTRSDNGKYHAFFKESAHCGTPDGPAFPSFLALSWRIAHFKAACPFVYSGWGAGLVGPILGKFYLFLDDCASKCDTDPACLAFYYGGGGDCTLHEAPLTGIGL